MNEFLKMDVFFVVTTFAVIALSVLLVIALVRVLRILKNIEDVSELVEEEGKLLRADIADVRQNIKREGVRASHLIDFLSGTKKRRTKKS